MLAIACPTSQSRIVSQGILYLNPPPTHIGWSQVWKGRYSSEWQTLAETYYRDNPPAPRKATGSAWIRVISVYHMQSWLDLWKNCNQLCHSNSVRLLQAFWHHTIQSELQDVYSKKYWMHPVDWHILYARVEEHTALHLTLQMQELWLATFQSMIFHSINHAKYIGLAFQCQLDEWRKITSPSE